MTASQYFTRKSVIAFTNMHHGSGDRYVLLDDVLKVFAALEQKGTTVTFDDDEDNQD